VGQEADHGKEAAVAVPDLVAIGFDNSGQLEDGLQGEAGFLEPFL